LHKFVKKITIIFPIVQNSRTRQFAIANNKQLCYTIFKIAQTIHGRK